MPLSPEVIYIIILNQFQPELTYFGQKLDMDKIKPMAYQMYLIYMLIFLSINNNNNHASQAVVAMFYIC